MSTKSIIGMKKDKETVLYAHCHYDGYPESMITMLEALKVKEIEGLVSKGLIIEVECEMEGLEGAGSSTFYSTDKKDYPLMRKYSNESFLLSHTVSLDCFLEDRLSSEYEACYTYLYDKDLKEWHYWEGYITKAEKQTFLPRSL